VEKVDIGLENARTRLKELLVYYVVKTLMIHFHALRRFALNAIRWDILRLTAKKLILLSAIDADSTDIKRSDA
jgi:hypothetical protein